MFPALSACCINERTEEYAYIVKLGSTCDRQGAKLKNSSFGIRKSYFLSVYAHMSIRVLRRIGIHARHRIRTRGRVRKSTYAPRPQLRA